MGSLMLKSQGPAMATFSLLHRAHTVSRRSLESSTTHSPPPTLWEKPHCNMPAEGSACSHGWKMPDSCAALGFLLQHNHQLLKTWICKDFVFKTKGLLKDNQ